MRKEEIEILIVEDDANDLELAMHALSVENICNQIQVARDGEEALDFLFCRNAFRERDPDYHPRLVLLDLKLPKLDGLEVLRQIKGNPRTKSLPVVILTSSKQERDMVRGYELGVNSYIQKPVDFEQFCAVIRQLGYYWLLVNQSSPGVTVNP